MVCQNLEHEDFFYVLNTTSCLIGNTSAAIREGSFIGAPAVSVGSRQNVEIGENIINSKPNSKEIYNKVLRQMKLKKKSR